MRSNRTPPIIQFCTIWKGAAKLGVTWKSTRLCVKNFCSSPLVADACLAAFLASTWPHSWPLLCRKRKKYFHLPRRPPTLGPLKGLISYVNVVPHSNSRGAPTPFCSRCQVLGVRHDSCYPSGGVAKPFCYRRQGEGLG